MYRLNNLRNLGKLRLDEETFFSALGKKLPVKLAEKLGRNSALNKSRHDMNGINIR